MASLTIRNLDESVKQRLRVQAAGNGRSMEEEARVVLQSGVGQKKEKRMNIAMALREIALSVGGVDLELPPRQEARDPPDFS